MHRLFITGNETIAMNPSYAFRHVLNMCVLSIDESKLETLKISTFLHYTTRNVKMWQVLEQSNIEDDILSLVSILSLF
jgi:hypothetical protein